MASARLETTLEAPRRSREELLSALRQAGEERYHHRHPFHQLKHEGTLTRWQLQAWALNRYQYQSIIPIEDVIILSRSDDPALRRAWRKRIVDHDGDHASEHGIKRQLKLAEGLPTWIPSVSLMVEKYCPRHDTR